MGQMIEFPANGNAGSGYLAVPPSGSGPGVLLIQEWWGLVDHIKDVADRLAREGFMVLAPDFYHGTATKSPDEAGRLFMALNVARVGADLKGAADALRARNDVTSERVTVLGFCMGGQLALYAGAQYPDRISGVVDFYGIHPNVRVDPANVKVPVLGHFAKRDNSVREADARALMAKIEAAGGLTEAYYYDADHAFFNDTRPTVYNKEAAQAAWTRTLTFLRKQAA